MIPVIRQTPAKKANTLVSIENTIQYGTPTSAVSDSNQRMRIMPRPRPTPPLMKASSRLSTISWRTIRHRVAPSETRTAISRDRCAARASSRLATFEQAMSSTNATAPISDQNIVRICVPRTRSMNGVDCADMSLLVSWCSCASCAEMLVSSLRACSSVTPSARRP